MRKWVVLVYGLFILGVGMPVFAGEEIQPDTTLYIGGLEALVQDDTVLAESSFMKLVDQYPESMYISQSRGFLEQLHSYVDNSGIVTFYLGNLATATYTAMMIPILFDIDEEALTYGLAGIAGVGLGLTGSALMAADYPITAGLSWWVSSAQIISLGNYFYLTGIMDLKDMVGDDVYLSGQLVTINGALLGSYFALRDADVSKGKGSFILQSYLWANAYYWMGTIIAESHDVKTNSSIGMAVTDLALAGSFPLWEKLRWSPMRTGLVTVGGLGGALMGWFSTMVVDEFFELETPDFFRIIMGSTIAGQTAAVYLTSGMETEKETPVHRTGMHSGRDAPVVALFPVSTDEGLSKMRLVCSLSF